jgi:predicted GNAT family N-acyltransferase
MIVVRQIASAADREAAYDVRRRVFQDEQGVPADEEFDADDEIAVHAIALVGNTVVGTGRLIFPPGYAKIGRLAVLREWRAHGVGRALLEALMAEAARQGAPRAVLHAQVQALGFYERAGFVAVGDEFDEAGIPHRRMERAL